jgi:SulP family sulfate permease
MSPRRESFAPAPVPTPPLRPAAAMREALREGYTLRKLATDATAGVVVGIVALPLSMALAIAAGVPPQYGLYTAIVAGGAIALLGGSRTLVSGPTAAFVAVLLPITHHHGLGGLCLATLMAGAILFGLGAARLGRLIQFVPNPVTTGFTAGIAVVIAILQLKDFLGLTTGALPEHAIEKVGVLGEALGTARWPEWATGLFTLVVLIAWPRLVTRRVPGPVVALALAGVGAWALSRWVPGFAVDTIGSRFSYLADGVVQAGIPRTPPPFTLPWTLPGADGAPIGLSLELVRELVPSAFAIAILGAIESLLAAVSADALAGHSHDPDAELMAQGTGNLLAPFFGGFAATGAIARTAANVQAGGRSPVSAVVHSLFLLAAVLVLAPLLAHLPMASLAAVLLMVAWNMSDLKHLARVLRVAPRGDAIVLLSCFALTVAIDMVVAVVAGVMLAAMMFMRRMAELTGARVTEPSPNSRHGVVPPGVMLYEIGGPLFFGAAQKTTRALDRTPVEVKVVVLDLSAVPHVDATGLISLESALARLATQKVLVLVTGVQPGPEHALQRAGVRAKDGVLEFLPSLEDGLERARAVVA